MFGLENTHSFLSFKSGSVGASIGSIPWEFRQKSLQFFWLFLQGYLIAVVATALVIVSIFQTGGKKKIVFIPGKIFASYLYLSSAYVSVTRPVSCDLSLASRKTRRCLYFVFFCFKLSTLRFLAKPWMLGRSGEWISGGHLVVSTEGT